MLGKDLASIHNNQKAPDFSVQVLGTPRDLGPLVRNDIFLLACEAVRNAFQHANAARIEVEVTYGPRQLRLRVRDNGRGI